MAIPYGAVALIAAALLAVMGAKQAAVPVAVGGFVVAGSAGLSLKNWRGSQPATPFTLVSAGEAVDTCCASLLVHFQKGTLSTCQRVLCLCAQVHLRTSRTPAGSHCRQA